MKNTPPPSNDVIPAPESDTPRRVVAIVGRPNVGKSAIFNRLAGQRIAIVHGMPGVTRDRLMRDVEWGGHPFSLIDTGGISSIDNETQRDRIEAGIQQQAKAALDDASVAILVVDITAGLTPLDTEVARLLRKQGVTVFVAANKADDSALEAAAPEFARLGFPVFPVSALHDRGFGDLMERVLRALPPVRATDADDEANAEAPLLVAIVGRPNAGKSSFINCLLNSERVLVSDVPGTTRDSIDVPFTIGEGEAARHYLLIDTAGARRESKIDTAVERISKVRMEKSVERCDVAVLVLDCERGVSLLEKKLAGLIEEQAKGCLIMVNKWDLDHDSEKSFAAAVRRELPFMDHCPIVFASAKNGYHTRYAIDVLDDIARQLRATIPTGILNRVLIEACEHTPPPSRGPRHGRMYYATQVATNPVTIRIFVNDPGFFPLSYREYLINRLRGRFGLDGAPVRIQFRARTRTERGFSKDGKK